MSALTQAGAARADGIAAGDLASHADSASRTCSSRSESYWQLPADRRQALSDDMVEVAQFIVGGSSGHNVPRAATLVGALQAATALGGFLGTRVDPAGQTAGSRFAQGGGAVAAKQGAADYTAMIRDVNFPAFVAVIDGVFNAIVTSSIKQMDAYAELVKNVAKSVDDFMKDNISENSARDYLANRYPDHLQVDTSGDSPVLKPKDGADDSSLPDFFKDLGLAEAGNIARPGHRRAGAHACRAATDGHGPPAAAGHDGADGHQPSRRDGWSHPGELHVHARHHGLGQPSLRHRFPAGQGSHLFGEGAGLVQPKRHLRPLQ